MTPNVSRFLIKWGVSDIIGDDLVQCDSIRMRRRDGKTVAYTELMPKTKRELGFPVSGHGFLPMVVSEWRWSGVLIAQ